MSDTPTPQADEAQPSLGGIAPHRRVTGLYAVRNPQVGTSKAGKHYLRCLLADATGEVATRKWGFDPDELGPIAEIGFARVSGQTQDFNGQLQLVLDGIQPASPTDEELRALMPSTTQDVEAMFDEVSGLLRGLEHPAMRALADAYLADQPLMARFRVAPAAISFHHAWLGGLLEHTWQLMRLADRMLPCYPGLNRDLVLMGLFLHDLAKTTELEWERGFRYSVKGNLVGHLVLGAVWLQVKAAIAASSGERLPAEALDVLQHIVVSSHGRLEHGAAKRPSTPEAQFVAALDDLDARATVALTAVDRAALDGPAGPAGGAFTEQHWALETRLYRPDPLS